MTTWPDDDELADDIDFMDPTAPPDGEEPEQNGPADDWRAQAVPEGSTEHDLNNVVHLWLEPETQKLAKIRISNRWRERMKGQPLGICVTIALRGWQKQFGNTTPQEDAPAVEVGSAKIDQAFMNRWMETLFSVTEREKALDALPPEQVKHGRWVGDPTVATSDNRMVTVTLGRMMKTLEVDIDEEWAQKANVSQICDAIQEAHNAAYAAYVEPEYEPGEYDELQNELIEVHAEMKARIANYGTPGGTR
ncbi:hypothetical protein ACQBAU_11745 [Propionibacteriaceae bacterium Y2011]